MDPLGNLLAWFGEKMIEAADDKLVDGLQQRGDIQPADSPILKRAGPIYVKALLAEMKRASDTSKPAP